MKRIFLLLWPFLTLMGFNLLFAVCLLLCGCMTPEEQAAKKQAEAAAQQAAAERAAAQQAAAEQQAADFKAKLEGLKTKKILNIRTTDTTVDFVLEDGTITTFYSYTTEGYSGGNRTYTHHLGVK